MIFLSTYRKPVVIAGKGCREAGAAELLLEFYKKTKIPILTTMNAVDLIQDEDKIGFIGVYGNRIANMILKECDLVISIGARLGIRQIGNKKEYFAPKAHLIRADIDQYELSRNIKEDEAKYLIDAKEFIQNLLNEDIPVYEEWNKKCFEAKELLKSYDKELGNLCIEKISSLLPKDAVVSVDVGQTQCWSAQSLTLKGQNGRILIGGGYGSMGCGLPYAIGASIAMGGQNVYCITGDGGLQMNIQELQAVVSERLPIKILVVNNKALGKIAEIQSSAYNHHMMITNENSGYHVPDFEKIACAYGMKAKTLNQIEELDECAEWLMDNEPCLINILLPQATILMPKMNWNEKEMKPVLPDEIIDKAKRVLR